jgi:hypothetical protein
VLAGLLIVAVGLPGSSAPTLSPSCGQRPSSGARPRCPHRVPAGDPFNRGGIPVPPGGQVLQRSYLIDLCATAFGLPRALFPAQARIVFHGGPATLGILDAVPATGALVASLTSGWPGRVRRYGRLVIVAVLAWAVAIVALGFADRPWLAFLLLAVSGWADAVSAVSRSSMVQTAVSETFRGRIAAVQMAVVQGDPRPGDLESGVVAAASTRFSIVSRGIACAIGALALAVFLPGFRRYRQRPFTSR